jgi:hypothetical protein
VANLSRGNRQAGDKRYKRSLIFISHFESI